MTRAEPDAIALAYESCRRVTAERARSFYLGLRLAPEPERSALYALYAWNRLGDDIADDVGASVNERSAQLDAFAVFTREVCSGRCASDDALWVALADVVDRFAIDPLCFEAMISGLRRDLNHHQPETFADLGRYCDEVAGSVGRCCIAVWGVRQGVSPSHAADLADSLGRAFQITNILRDVGEDAQLDPPRHYLPRDTLAAHGLAIEDVLAWRRPDACQSLVLELAARARSSFAEGKELLDLVRPRFRPTLWAMVRIYERTLGLIEDDPRRAVRTTHVRPNTAVKLSIACRAFAMSALASGRE